MMNWIFGLPETVSAEISNMYSPKMPNDTAVLLFKYANGMIGRLLAHLHAALLRSLQRFTVKLDRSFSLMVTRREGCRVRIDDKRIYEL